MNRIKQLRTEAGLSLRDLAKDFSVFLEQHGKKPTTNVTISRWENEKNCPTAEMWGLLADYFNVSVNYLQGNCPVSVNSVKMTWTCRLTTLPGGLKKIRLKRALTLKSLSEKTGIPVSTLSQYENGKRKLRGRALEKLACYFDVSPNVLKTRWIGGKQ